jgi:hypothetical protein
MKLFFVCFSPLLCYFLMSLIQRFEMNVTKYFVYSARYMFITALNVLNIPISVIIRVTFHINYVPVTQ